VQLVHGALRDAKELAAVRCAATQVVLEAVLAEEQILF
jgi:hypothetical protein